MIAAEAPSTVAATQITPSESQGEQVAAASDGGGAMSDNDLALRQIAAACIAGDNYAIVTLVSPLALLQSPSLLICSERMCQSCLPFPRKGEWVLDVLRAHSRVPGRRWRLGVT